MAKRKTAFRKKRQNRMGMFLVSTVILMLLLVVTVKSVELTSKLSVNRQYEEQLLEQIAQEEQRKQEIEEYSKYTKTKKYIEEVAKDKLGLVNEGEIVFQEE